MSNANVTPEIKHSLRVGLQLQREGAIVEVETVELSPGQQLLRVHA